MSDIKDKIIADLRSELDTARAVIKLMEENERLAEERHEHELREASVALGKLHERVQKALDANRKVRGVFVSNPMIGTAVCAEEDCLRMVRGWIDEVRRV